MSVVLVNNVGVVIIDGVELLRRCVNALIFNEGVGGFEGAATLEPGIAEALPDAAFIDGMVVNVVVAVMGSIDGILRDVAAAVTIGTALDSCRVLMKLRNFRKHVHNNADGSRGIVLENDDVSIDEATVLEF